MRYGAFWDGQDVLQKMLGKSCSSQVLGQIPALAAGGCSYTFSASPGALLTAFVCRQLAVTSEGQTWLLTL